MLSENETLAIKKKEEGNKYTTQKNYSKAIQCYNDAIHYNSQMKEAWFNKGLAHIFLNQYNEALMAFNEAIRIDPNYQKAIDNRNFVQAKIFIMESKYQEAYKLLKQCPKTARVELATIQSANQCKAEIFFGRVDLKFTDSEEIKILRFGNGMQSGFSGLEQIYDKSIVDLLKENLLSFGLPFLMVDHPGTLPLNKFSKALEFIEKNNINEQTAIDFSTISNYAGIYCGLHFEPKLYQNILKIGDNISTAIIADDTLLTHQMFVESDLQQYRPLTKVLPRKYSSLLSKQIHKEMHSNIYMIRVPDLQKDLGTWFATEHDLDEILKFLLEPNDDKAMELFFVHISKFNGLNEDLINLFITWRSSNSTSFMVDAYTPSKLVVNDKKTYDATMRVAFLIIRDNYSLTFKPIGACWQLPKATSSHSDIRLRSNAIISAQEQSYLPVAESDLSTVYQQLSIVLPKVFQRMFTFDFEAYRQQLIASAIDNERSYGYYVTTRIINELGNHGYVAAALELLTSIEHQYSMPYKIYHERGMVYYNNNFYDKAVEQFSEALKRFSNIPTYYRRGLSYYALGMIDKALADLNYACTSSQDIIYRAAYEQIKQEIHNATMCASSSSAPSMSVDLHGASVKKAKEVVDTMLTRAKDQKIDKLTIITGIGNHVNRDGSRGVLFNVLPKWLNKSSCDIKSIKQDMGAYEIQFNCAANYNNEIKKPLEEQLSLLNKKQLEEFLTQLEQKSQQGDRISKAILATIYIIGINKVPQNINKGLPLLMEAAESFVDAQLQLGAIFSSDHFPIKDYKQAIKWFSKAAEKKHPFALFELGKMYWLGCGVIRNDTKAIRYLTQATEFKLLEISEELRSCLVDKGFFIKTASLASISAANSLGEIYFYGVDSIKKDLELAAKFSLLAAKANIVDAQLRLAKQYFLGLGINNNDNQAFFWFEKAAIAGNAIAEYYVGYCYETGRGTVIDSEQAAIWYKKSAAQEDLDAQFKLAYGYLIGVFVKQDVIEALKQLKLLAERDHADSLFVLGETLIQEGAQQDIKSAIEYLTRAAKLEQVYAQKLLAQLYLNSDYCQIDEEQAIYWLREAAKQEDAEALHHLGIVLASKNNHIQTPESIVYLAKSAQLGFIGSQLILGLAYLEGDGIAQNPIKGIKLLEQAAIQGNDEAQVRLARLYTSSNGPVPSDYSKAFSYFQKAALQNNIDACTGLGFCYMNGYGVKVDQEKAAHYFEKAAQQGDVTAQINLAHLLQESEEKENLPKIIHWLTLAAQQGEKKAQYALGLKYIYLSKEQHQKDHKDFGAGIYWLYQAALQNHKEAINVFKKMISLGQLENKLDMIINGLSYEYKLRYGYAYFPSIVELKDINCDRNANAQSDLGLMYSNGAGVSQDDSKAIECFQKAANQGNATAQYNLGVMYEVGRGVSKNETKAIEWYQKAANQGNVDAQHNLGVMYARSGIIIPEDHAKTADWFQKAANQGDATAQYNLGVMYAKGTGISKNEAKAIEWYQKAANQGYVDAQYALGFRYENGEGVPKNYAKAAEWYQKAANQGNAKAQVNLGAMYVNNKGIAQDYTKEVELFQKAANHGNSDAQHNLGVMYANGTGVLQSDVKALEWYQKAADQGHVFAQVNLGAMYANGGIGVSQNYVKAIEYFQKAANQGNVDAQHNLEWIYEKRGKGSAAYPDYTKSAEWYQKPADQTREGEHKRQKTKVIHKKQKSPHPPY